MSNSNGVIRSTNGRGIRNVLDEAPPGGYNDSSKSLPPQVEVLCQTMARIVRRLITTENGEKGKIS